MLKDAVAKMASENSELRPLLVPLLKAAKEMPEDAVLRDLYKHDPEMHTGPEGIARAEEIYDELNDDFKKRLRHLLAERDRTLRLDPKPKKETKEFVKLMAGLGRMVSIQDFFDDPDQATWHEAKGDIQFWMNPTGSALTREIRDLTKDGKIPKGMKVDAKALMKDFKDIWTDMFDAGLAHRDKYDALIQKETDKLQAELRRLVSDELFDLLKEKHQR